MAHWIESSRGRTLCHLPTAVDEPLKPKTECPRDGGKRLKRGRVLASLQPLNRLWVHVGLDRELRSREALKHSRLRHPATDGRDIDRLDIHVQT